MKNFMFPPNFGKKTETVKSKVRFPGMTPSTGEDTDIDLIGEPVFEKVETPKKKTIKKVKNDESPAE
jgi:hypothetical protein